MGRVSSRAASKWLRSPGYCRFRGVFWVGRIFFVFFFRLFSSDAHGLLQVRGHLASFTSLLIMRSFFAYRQKSLFILGCVQGASISLVCLSVCLCPSCVTFVVFTDCESCTRPISTNPGSIGAGEYGLARGTCFVACCLEVVAVAGLLWISVCS